MGGYSPYRGDRITDLILEGGDIAARQAQNSGGIWGNVLGNVSQIAGNAYQQYGEAKQAEQMAKRDAAWVSYVQSGKWMEDPKGAYMQSVRTFGPGEQANRQFMALNGAMTLFQDKRNPKEYEEAAARMTVGLADRPHAARVPLLPAAVALVRKRLPQVQVSDEPTEEEFNNILLPAARSVLGEKPEFGEVGAGGTVYNKSTGEVKFTAPVAEKAETRSLDVQAADALAKGDTQTYERLLTVKKEMGQADDRPITVNTGRQGLSPTMESNVVNRLTKSWESATAPVKELNRQVKLLDVGLNQVRQGNMAQGAQTILVTFQKILDPPSVVRESEYMRSAAGLALMDRVKGAYERLTKGGAGVPLAELEKFAELAREAARAQATGHIDSVKERIGRQADRYNIPRDLVFEDFDFAGGGTPAQAAATPAAGGPHPMEGKIVEDPQGNRYRILNGEPVPMPRQ